MPHLVLRKAFSGSDASKKSALLPVAAQIHVIFARRGISMSVSPSGFAAGSAASCPSPPPPQSQIFFLACEAARGPWRTIGDRPQESDWPVHAANLSSSREIFGWFRQGRASFHRGQELRDMARKTARAWSLTRFPELATTVA